jgi:hypothetical protein
MYVSNIIFLCITGIVFTLCTVFASIGDSYTQAKTLKLPRSVYSDWFIFPSLFISLLGYGYVAATSNVATFSFAMTSTVLLTSLALLYGFVYMGVKKGTTVQTFAFNVFINTVFLMFNVVFNNKNYIASVIALIPMLLLSGYYLYIGHILAIKT